MKAPLESTAPLTALAPMQDVTDVCFMNAIAAYGCPDYFFTEYFRVHPDSSVDKYILRSITENTTGRPVFAQILGEHIPDLVRIARLLMQYPIAGIDLNMGCPAPRVYRKNVGGGLLKDPDKIDRILGELRAAVDGKLTVKMRIGFEDTSQFDRVLDLIDRHDIDLLSLHGRTVKQMYHGSVDYDLIAHAVKRLRCPVFANGNVSSAASAMAVLSQTQAAGVTIGRAAIRNPWIFRQIREAVAGKEISIVTLAQVREYIDRLHQMQLDKSVPEKSRVSHLKMYLNFIGQSVDAAGVFLRDMRKAQTEAELFGVCDRELLDRAGGIFAPEPYVGLIARPSCEA
ncbi:tRNA dihydrouridine synthase [Chamaesiphon minutus]|uniref:tRNA-dihydrouridine synthase n=1 Tax=Chamaesiphon minutus (strain ATCC 27169 / PCC 6605) TaxID=1173020 RepID=K9UNV9_CHAP6|nr:tRNA-dihydrouridine synthase family protein [Chamaesiphon minutus]AFY96353.1 tRNA-dihydrouridine synthase [Chamaesiphon minutus PCC 6605]